MTTVKSWSSFRSPVRSTSAFLRRWKTSSLLSGNGHTLSEMPTLNRAVASLRLAGEDLVPAEITEALGAEPSHAYARGDDLPVTKTQSRIARTGQWRLSAIETCPADVDTQVTELLARLTNDLDVWRHHLSIQYRPVLRLVHGRLERRTEPLGRHSDSAWRTGHRVELGYLRVVPGEPGRNPHGHTVRSDNGCHLGQTSARAAVGPLT